MRIFLYFILSLMLFSCGSKENTARLIESDEPLEAPQKELTQEEIETQTKEAVEKYKKLYSDLNKFRHNSVFHFHKFGVNSPARNWMIEVQQLGDNCGDLLLTKRLVPGDMIMLASEWADSKGRNTEISKTIQKDIESNLY